jgi:capsular exopolysaccharide synthesis family protein
VSQSPYSSSTDWLRPPEEEQGGLKRYAETLRERFWTIAVSVIVCTGIAVLYVLTATKTYESTANMLVTPVSANDPVLAGLGLLRESSDPTRDVQTASQLIANIDVARRAAEDLGGGESPQDLLAAIVAEPVANSNIVAVVATENSPEEAQAVANAFAKAAVAERTAELHAQIATRLPRLEAIGRSDAEGAETGGVSVAGQIAELKALESGPDPTMRIQTKATLPAGQASPDKALSLAAGVLVGLIIGLAGAFSLQVLDPRLRREAQLRRLYRLPVLARIPRSKGTRHGPLAPGRSSPLVDEAYRTLRATLTGRRLETSEGGRVILVTSSSSGEGKTSTALSLASSLALLGKRVLTIEADLRRPALGRLLGVNPDKGVVAVLTGRATLREAVVNTEDYGPSFGVLPAEGESEGDWVTELFATPAAEDLLAEARAVADYVVIDSPPVSEVIDGLPLAAEADDVLLVVKLGRSRLDRLQVLGELLAESGIVPAGFVLIGVPAPTKSDDHYATRSPGALIGGEKPSRSRPPSASRN